MGGGVFFFTYPDLRSDAFWGVGWGGFSPPQSTPIHFYWSAHLSNLV